MRRIVFVVFDRFELLDLAGPSDVIAHANRTQGGYEREVVSLTAGLVRSAGGVTVGADHGIGDLSTDGIDTLVIVGGPGVDAACRNPALVAWVAAAGASARRVAAVCTGIFLLAATGLAAGRRVTTHWSREKDLIERHPELRVDCDPIFIHDRRVWTSAGVSAGMDLALALVEEDHGATVAHAVARELVLFLRRPGSQSQFSVPLWSVQPSTDPIRTVVEAIHADPGARHSIADLAARGGVSARHLQRRFAAEMGVPPAAYVERVRIEAARRGLTEDDEPVATVARRFGFGTAETLRRSFHRHLGVAPSEYRQRFRSANAYD